MFIKDNHLDFEKLTHVEIQELYQLVQEIKKQGFYYSSDLSGYITRNKLGNKYPHICGIVMMNNQSSSWKLNGGFPSKIYRLVCTTLKLKSRPEIKIGISKLRKLYLVMTKEGRLVTCA
jgi:hypothetical protein